MSNKVSTYNSYTYYKYYISQNIYIFLTISAHLKIYQILFQEFITKNPFSWKTYIYNVKNPSYEIQKLIILRVILMKGNITHIGLKTKRALHEESHLSAWWKGINLTNLCTRLDMLSLSLSLSPVAPIFPFQSWSHHGRTHNIILFHWTCFIALLKSHKSTAVLRLELQIVKISQNFSIFNITLLSTC